jgi:hypothetical protein
MLTPPYQVTAQGDPLANRHLPGNPEDVDGFLLVVTIESSPEDLAQVVDYLVTP